MDFVTAIPKYFEMISQDVQSLCEKKGTDNNKYYLIVSVALRALGGLLAFNTVRCVVACLINPLTLMGCVTSAVIAFILASDLLKVGHGMRAAFQLHKSVETSSKQEVTPPQVKDGDKTAFSWDMGKGDGFAPGFHETMVLKHAYALWVYGKGLLDGKKSPEVNNTHSTQQKV